MGLLGRILKDLPGMEPERLMEGRGLRGGGALALRPFGIHMEKGGAHTSNTKLGKCEPRTSHFVLGKAA